MPTKERWIVFYLDGKEILSFTVRGMMVGEIRESIRLLAYEKGVPASSIYIAEVIR